MGFDGGTNATRLRAAQPVDQAGPMLDGLACLADRLGKRLFLFVVHAPMALVVHFDEMSQCAAGSEQLPLGVIALDFGRA